MTDLLTRPGSRTPRTTDGAGDQTRRRSLALTATLAGLGTAFAVLCGFWVLALAGWFASDAGGHGTTRDALRVGTDGWLLGLGADLHLSQFATTVTAMPLGLTLLSVWVARRLGARAAAAAEVDDLRTLLLGVVVMAGVHGLVALLAALLASTQTAEVSLLGAFVGGSGVALLGGGVGMLRARSDLVGWSRHVPEWARAVGFGAVSAVLVLFAVSSVVLTAALAVHLGSAANVLSRLHTGLSGGLLYTALVAAVAPNAVLLTGSYLLGPGFAVGAGTLVSPGAVTLAPVPAFPLLAALPHEGTPPGWSSFLVAAPVVAAVLAVVLMMRRYPAYTWESGALRGVVAGLLGGLLTALATGLAGGAVGPGRMAHVGAPWLDTLVAATVAMGVGGLVAGVATTAFTWWTRRGSGAR